MKSISLLLMKRAWMGEIPYRVGSMRLDGDGVICTFVETFTARSLPHAIQQCTARHPDNVIYLLEPIEGRVCIKLFIAYPCRLARRIFSYRQFRRVEAEAINAILELQARQTVLRQIKGGKTILEPAKSSNAANDPTLPANVTESPLVRREAVAMDEHASPLPDAPVSNQSISLSLTPATAGSNHASGH